MQKYSVVNVFFTVVVAQVRIINVKILFTMENVIHVKELNSWTIGGNLAT
ncbi:MAG TPA: hypothetical protein VE130_09180 [Nitrososphaeraceae archaeon]|nr:hypothetical protein [Nitrososphaeraceae archaeon]